MTTTVKVSCGGENYRAKIEQPSRAKPLYVYQVKRMADGKLPPNEAGVPMDLEGFQIFGVGSDGGLTVTEEYSPTGWNRETHQPNP